MSCTATKTQISETIRQTTKGRLLGLWKVLNDLRTQSVPAPFALLILKNFALIQGQVLPHVQEVEAPANICDYVAGLHQVQVKSAGDDREANIATYQQAHPEEHAMHVAHLSKIETLLAEAIDVTTHTMPLEAFPDMSPEQLNRLLLLVDDEPKKADPTEG